MGGAGGVRAEYGPMGSLAGVLSGQADVLAGEGVAGPVFASGNPQMDAALADLAAWVQLCTESLTTTGKATANQVTTTMGHFHSADG